MKLSRVGIDLAKNVYQLHGVDRSGKTMWKRRLRRGPYTDIRAAEKSPVTLWGFVCPDMQPNVICLGDVQTLLIGVG